MKKENNSVMQKDFSENMKKEILIKIS